MATSHRLPYETSIALGRMYRRSIRFYRPAFMLQVRLLYLRYLAQVRTFRSSRCNRCSSRSPGCSNRSSNFPVRNRKWASCRCSSNWDSSRSCNRPCPLWRHTQNHSTIRRRPHPCTILNHQTRGCSLPGPFAFRLSDQSTWGAHT